jgi:hypothetical protein
MELAFASLHLLCGPMLDRLDALPAPQRQALEIVFGLSAGNAPDRFLVALATLSLFSEVAEERPLLCVVDDAQWLDQASALTLAFVARRLLAEPVGIVFATREPVQELDHLPELEVRGLRSGDAGALRSSAVGFKLDAQVRDQIIAETRGNPLALLELPRGLTTTQLAGGFGLPGAQVPSGRIEQSFVRQLQALSDQARRLLLVAAAEPVGDPLLLWRAAERLGIGPTGADEAQAHGLLAVAERVTFRQPLARSAVYRSATARDRREVHMALSQATDPNIDPDRRAWHLAAAAAGSDEEVARELEYSAARANARGGLAAAAAFLTRAAGLTPVPSVRVRRTLDAAFANVQAGGFDTAQCLLSTVGEGPIDELQHARVDLLRAQVAFASSRGNEATPLLLAAAQRLESLDIALARETYLDAFIAALFAGRSSIGVGLHDVADAARAAPHSLDSEPTAGDLLLDALAALLASDDEDAAVTLTKAALHKLCVDDTPSIRMRWLWLGCAIASDLWDDNSWYLLSNRHLEVARSTGALSELPHALNALATMLVFCGELASAASLLEEGQSAQEATGIRTAPYAMLGLAAWQGKTEVAAQLIEATARDAGSAARDGDSPSASTLTHFCVTAWASTRRRSPPLVALATIHKGGQARILRCPS